MREEFEFGFINHSDLNRVDPDDDHDSLTTDKDMWIKTCDWNVAIKVERTLLCARPCT